MPTEADHLLVPEPTLPPTTIYKFSGGSHAWGIIGEKCAIRGVQVGNPEEKARYWETEQATNGGDMVDGFASIAEMVANAKNGLSLGFTFVVAGIDQIAGAQEAGKFQGIVQFSIEKPDNPPYREILERNKDFGLCLFKKPKLLEVSFEKFPGSAKHQIAAAVRQGGLLVYKIFHQAEGLSMADLAIMAFQQPGNRNSSRVLGGSCFDRVALIHPTSGLTNYDLDSESPDRVWILNWPRLLNKEFTIAHAATFV